MTPRFSLIATAGLVTGLLTGGAAFAQMPPPPPAGAFPPPHPALAPEAGMTVQGRVAQWLLNPNGEADGLLLTDGTQVAFPPHLSTSVMQIFKPGDTVRIAGWRAPNVPVMRALTLEAGGRTVVDQPPAPGMFPPGPRDLAALSAMSVGGRIERLLYTDRGDVHGVILADRSIVRFPPHIGAVYGSILQPGAQLFAQGWGTRGPNGSAVEATSLGQSADSVRELVGGPVGPVGPRGPHHRHLMAPMGPMTPMAPVPPVPAPVFAPQPAANS
ncbi:hypothetical protein FHT32_005714 [Variovorax sp. SG517]|uniref:hypothetical protein n=1 Tax=Variovorax sp. SG517 TaxID=2587117 RepID=UPI00159E1C5E|nr:hypothetical protein [Variovorax sp. SG517]NVM92028.1 hypothetical protein [Variovorax sp. SG517]